MSSEKTQETWVRINGEWALNPVVHMDTPLGFGVYSRSPSSEYGLDRRGCGLSDDRTLLLEQMQHDLFGPVLCVSHPSLSSC